MKIKFISRIRKGNNRGTGFAYLPKDKINLFNLGDWVRVKVLKNKFFAKIIFYSHRLGVYVPKYIVIENNLINREVEIQIEKVDGFYTKMYSDGRIYIPKDIVKKQSLNHNDIVLVKGIVNGKVIYEKFSKIHVIKRKNRPVEYLCIFGPIFYTKELLFKIEKCSKEAFKEDLSLLVAHLLKGIHYAFVSKDSVIIFKGNKVPAIVSTKIKYPDIAFYLGAYFADGTRKGNSWALCASTFEQARYYLKMHNFLIKDSRPEFTISYTNIYNIEENKLKKDLAEIWQKEVGIEVNKFRIRKPSGKSISKWHKYGTLVIREHRQILLDVYNGLLKLLIREILLKKDSKLAIDFICGVMEGDGCAPATKRGHVMIFSNKKEINVLEKVIKVSQMKFKINKLKEEDRYSLRLGALEILRNFDLLRNRIFILYPKRRTALFERLKTVGAVKFLIGSHEPTSWIKSRLRNNGFCGEGYQITKSGLSLGSNLLGEMEKAGVE